MSARPAAYRAALYMRLSRDDEGAGESSSITNQRRMLTRYAQEHEYLIVDEYVDDGYSGTNFDRPEFQRMIADVEAKKLDLVLTKDLSRLGRDYIQTGQYTEIYFPSKKVRYIAVNDGFDSEDACTDIAPFKNVVNEMYARDTSKKIRSALAVKQHSGSYIGNFAPYGYRKDPCDKNHLIPDEEAAAVVREIFDLSVQGHRPGEIACALNARGVLPPALYRCAQHPGLNADSYSKRKEWTPGAVTKLLRNIVYLGHMAQGKTTKVSFKSGVTLSHPPSEWIVVRGTHEPLVSEEQFETARARARGRACRAKGTFINLFSGLARCADCGRSMSTVGSRKKGSPANLACGSYKLYGAKACSNHFIDYNALYRIVLDAVRRQTSLTEGERAELLRALRAKRGEERTARGEFGRLQAETARIDRLVELLYHDFMGGKINEQRFYRLLEKYEKQGEASAEKLTRLKDRQAAPCEAQRPGGGADLLAEAVKKYTDITQLDAELLFELVDHIEIGQGWYENTPHGRIKHQSVNIVFRFLTQPGQTTLTV